MFRTFLSIVVTTLVVGFTLVANGQQATSVMSQSTTGAVFDAPKPAYLRVLGLKKPPRGVLVIQVFEGTPAAKAGLQSGDVVTTLNGKKIKRYRDFMRTVNAGRSGSEFTLGGKRQGKSFSTSVSKVPLSSVQDDDFQQYQAVCKALYDMTMYTAAATSGTATPSKEVVQGLMDKAQAETNQLFTVRLQTILRRLK